MSANIPVNHKKNISCAIVSQNYWGSKSRVKCTLCLLFYDFLDKVLLKTLLFIFFAVVISEQLQHQRGTREEINKSHNLLPAACLCTCASHGFVNLAEKNVKKTTLVVINISHPLLILQTKIALFVFLFCVYLSISLSVCVCLSI